MGSAARKLRVWRTEQIFAAHTRLEHPVLVHVDVVSDALAERQIRERFNSRYGESFMSYFWWELTELPPITDLLS